MTNTNTATGVTPPNTSSLDDQTKAFIQQLIDSAMACIQASFQESLRQVVLQQDYLKADVQQLKNREGTSNGGNILLFGRITKLEFPKFTGVDVKSWLYKSQQFFSVEHVDDVNKVELASIHFFDSALVWHQQFEKLNDDSVSWEDYKKALLATFDTDFEDPLSELKNLKCDDTVQKYHEKFELLLNKVDMPEAHAISLFLGGMPQSISLPVRMFKPKSLMLLVCFVPGHKCSGQAFDLELVIDPDPQMEMCFMEGNEEEFVLLEISNESEIPQISLNALTGLTSYRTMRMIGHFGKQKIHILIDSGSTHNFLDVFMAKKLGCKIQQIDPLQVSVADGNKISTTSMCKKFSWMLNGKTFCTDAMLLPLGGCEMVLEVQWLATLGDIMWNFTSLKMQFQYEGRTVALRGTTKSPFKQLSKHVTQKSTNLSSISLCVPATSAVSLDATYQSVLEDKDKATLGELLKEFEDVFALPTSFPPQRQHDHRIPLKEDATPVNIRPYKHPPGQKDAIKTVVHE
ncbi:putative mitochondrial protein [Tanacetum coccineum]